MNSQAETRSIRSRTNKKKKKKVASGGWMVWWPLLIGIAVTPFALKTAEILPLMGADGLVKLRFLYPYALLLKEHAFGFSETTGDTLSQWMLYAQFPLYGFYVTLATRWKSWYAALLQVSGIHLLGFGVITLLARK
jgi:hypothetical protein